MSLPLHPPVPLLPGQSLAEAISGRLEAAIQTGRLPVGERLPAVRRLAAHLGCSPATVAEAYAQLARRGRARGEVGRGTFVAAPEPPPDRPPAAPPPGAPWRRRLMALSAARLAAAHPRAVDCASASPDPQLLPTELLRTAYRLALDRLRPSDLQYGGAEPDPELAATLSSLLASEGIATSPATLAVGSSALQLIDLGLRAAARRAGWTAPPVAVEQPGYTSALDGVDRLGWPSLPVAVDAEGVVPEALDAALGRGARLAILTTRGHNPTGASWTAARAAALAEVMVAHPQAVAIEDDHLGSVAATPLRSLLADPRLQGRVLHVRSFSKAIAPDLRLAVAVGDAQLRALLVEEKAYVDGWSSRLAQRALAAVLVDPALPEILRRARAAYAERRAAASAALLGAGLVAGGGAVHPAADGITLWVTLPWGVDEAAVLERAAAGGVIASPGEAFHVRPGHTGAVRLAVSAVDPSTAAAVGRILAAAALAGAGAAVGAVV